MTRAWVLCLLLAAASCIGCGTTAVERVRVPLTVRTAWPGGAVRAVDAEPVGVRTGVLPGLDHQVLELGDPPEPTADWYGAVIGSPVYDGHRLAGVIHELYGTHAVRLAGMLDAEFVEGAWDRVQAGGLSAAEWERVESGRALAPGEAVWVLAVWGDVSHGVQGTVTDVRGERVLLLAQDQLPYSPARSGPIARVLARAHVGAVATMPMLGCERLADVGPVVGAVVWHGAVETGAVTGALPPSMDVVCSISGSDGEVRQARFQVVRDAGADIVRSALTRLLAPTEFGVSGASARVVVQVDGGAPVETAVASGRGLPIRGIVQHVLGEVIDARGELPERVTISITP